MNMRCFALAACLLIPAAASAENDKDAVRTACRTDVKANCGAVFTRGQVITCLIEKAAVLSTPCTAALKTASCNSKAPANLKATWACSE